MTTARADRRRWEADLLDQQLWCWGRDVIGPEGMGNLLLRLGMCRFRSSDPKRDATAYTGRTPEGAVVWLWGFGLRYVAPNGHDLFLRRYRFDPVLLVAPPDRPAHHPDDLGPKRRPRPGPERAALIAALRSACRWIAAYEHWVAETFGREYRERTLMAREQPPVVLAADMAASWERLAAKVGRRRAGRARPNPGHWQPILERLRAAVEVAVDAAPAFTPRFSSPRERGR